MGGRDHRITYRRRHSYNTESNKWKIIKTPGNKYSIQYIGKRGTVPKCGDCKLPLQGLKAHRAIELSRISKTKKSVSRTYGASRCASCVKQRIVRAFLIEEQRIVKRVLKAQAAPAKTKGKK
eukprot:TRINITY_DN1841_c0_g1_i1.p3 TRINITY_DN1841_c0_g1~~TRINITY_DN1841_c0_g1_i1.p3  ORF type:complete len:122 (-),score=23.01 TRINITY_DN1841_c0_g1_i1:31-396(-)